MKAYSALTFLRRQVLSAHNRTGTVLEGRPTARDRAHFRGGILGRQKRRDSRMPVCDYAASVSPRNLLHKSRELSGSPTLCLTWDCCSREGGFRNQGYYQAELNNMSEALYSGQECLRPVIGRGGTRKGQPLVVHAVLFPLTHAVTKRSTTLFFFRETKIYREPFLHHF